MYTVTLLLHILYHYFVSHYVTFFCIKCITLCYTFLYHFPRERSLSLGAAGVDVKKAVYTRAPVPTIVIWSGKTRDESQRDDASYG